MMNFVKAGVNKQEKTVEVLLKSPKDKKGSAENPFIYDGKKVTLHY